MNTILQTLKIDHHIEHKEKSPFYAFCLQALAVVGVELRASGSAGTDRGSFPVNATAREKESSVIALLLSNSSVDAYH